MSEKRAIALQHACGAPHSVDETGRALRAAIRLQWGATRRL